MTGVIPPFSLFYNRIAVVSFICKQISRNITGSFARRDDAGILGELVDLTGVLYGKGARSWGTRCTGGTYGNVYLNFDASRSWGSAHTADEFRPRNKSVRYLIRAKP